MRIVVACRAASIRRSPQSPRRAGHDVVGYRCNPRSGGPNEASARAAASTISTMPAAWPPRSGFPASSASKSGSGHRRRQP
jgi:hypothetical protein